MPRKKNPNNNYFNSDVENAIHAYNKSTSEREKNQLFKIIYPALCKVSEVWYNKIKPVYVDLEPLEMQTDCVTFMLQKLPMVREGKGKAFSYLTVTAKHYYMIENQSAYKKKLKYDSLDAMPESFDIQDVPSTRAEEMELNGNLFDIFLEYIEENFEHMFPHKKQKAFAEPFIKKVKSYGLGKEFNRRKMLNELSDESGIERNIVTKHVNRIASFYTTFKDYYEVYGVKPKFKEKLHVTKEDEEYIKKNYQHYSKRNGLNGISRQLGIKYEVLKNWVKNSNL